MSRAGCALRRLLLVFAVVAAGSGGGSGGVVDAHAAAPVLVPMAGEPAPKLVLQGADGKLHDLAQYRGKVVLINFWATWCVPCRAEMPSLQRLRDKLAGQRFAVLAINVDEPEGRVRNFLRETALDLPVLFDRNKTATRAWGIRVMPTTFVVDADGRARYRVVGDIDWSNDTVVGTIAQLVHGG